MEELIKIPSPSLTTFENEFLIYARTSFLVDELACKRSWETLPMYARMMYLVHYYNPFEGCAVLGNMMGVTTDAAEKEDMADEEAEVTAKGNDYTDHPRFIALVRAVIIDDESTVAILLEEDRVIRSRHDASIGPVPDKLVDMTDSSGYTALHIAALAGATQSILALLKAGATVNARTHNRRLSPLLCAAWAAHAEATHVLLSNGAVIHDRSARLATPFHGAALRGSVRVVSVLMYHAARAAADLGPFVDATDMDKRCPAHLACAVGSAPLLQMCCDWLSSRPTSLVPIAGALVAGDSGIEVGRLNVTNPVTMPRIVRINTLISSDAFGYSPLHYAAACGSLAVCQVLAAQGRVWQMTLERESAVGATPLLTACFYGFADLVQYLLSAGANAAHATHAGVTCVHLAAGRDDVRVPPPLPLPAQLQLGPDAAHSPVAVLGFRAGLTHSPVADAGALLSLLVGAVPRSLLACADKLGNHPLHYAAARGNVDALLAAGIPLDATNLAGQTALLVACRNGCTASVRTLLRHPRSRALLRAVDAELNTVLHACAHSGDAEALALVLGHASGEAALLAFGASHARVPMWVRESVNAADSAGSTPLHVAARVRARGATLSQDDNEDDVPAAAHTPSSAQPLVSDAPSRRRGRRPVQRTLLSPLPALPQPPRPQASAVALTIKLLLAAGADVARLDGAGQPALGPLASPLAVEELTAHYLRHGLPDLPAAAHAYYWRTVGFRTPVAQLDAILLREVTAPLLLEAFANAWGAPTHLSIADAQRFLSLPPIASRASLCKRLLHMAVCARDLRLFAAIATCPALDYLHEDQTAAPLMLALQPSKPGPVVLLGDTDIVTAADAGYQSTIAEWVRENGPRCGFVLAEDAPLAPYPGGAAESNIAATPLMSPVFSSPSFPTSSTTSGLSGPNDAYAASATPAAQPANGHPSARARSRAPLADTLMAQVHVPGRPWVAALQLLCYGSARLARVRMHLCHDDCDDLRWLSACAHAHEDLSRKCFHIIPSSIDALTRANALRVVHPPPPPTLADMMTLPAPAFPTRVYDAQGCSPLASLLRHWRAYVSARTTAIILTALARATSDATPVGPSSAAPAGGLWLADDMGIPLLPGKHTLPWQQHFAFCAASLLDLGVDVQGADVAGLAALGFPLAHYRRIRSAVDTLLLRTGSLRLHPSPLKYSLALAAARAGIGAANSGICGFLASCAALEEADCARVVAALNRSEAQLDLEGTCDMPALSCVSGLVPECELPLFDTWLRYFAPTQYEAGLRAMRALRTLISGTAAVSPVSSKSAASVRQAGASPLPPPPEPPLSQHPQRLPASLPIVTPTPTTAASSTLRALSVLRGMNAPTPAPGTDAGSLGASVGQVGSGRANSSSTQVHTMLPPHTLGGVGGSTGAPSPPMGSTLPPSPVVLDVAMLVAAATELFKAPVALPPAVPHFWQSRGDTVMGDTTVALPTTPMTPMTPSDTISISSTPSIHACGPPMGWEHSQDVVFVVGQSFGFVAEEEDVTQAMNEDLRDAPDAEPDEDEEKEEQEATPKGSGAARSRSRGVPCPPMGARDLTLLHVGALQQRPMAVCATVLFASFMSATGKVHHETPYTAPIDLFALFAVDSFGLAPHDYCTDPATLLALRAWETRLGMVADGFDCALFVQAPTLLSAVDMSACAAEGSGGGAVPVSSKVPPAEDSQGDAGDNTVSKQTMQRSDLDALDRAGAAFPSTSAIDSIINAFLDVPNRTEERKQVLEKLWTYFPAHLRGSSPSDHCAEPYLPMHPAALAYDTLPDTRVPVAALQAHIESLGCCAYRFRRDAVKLDLVLVAVPYARLLLEAQCATRAEPSLSRYVRAELAEAAAALTASSTALSTLLAPPDRMQLWPSWSDVHKQRAVDTPQQLSSALASVGVSLARSRAHSPGIARWGVFKALFTTPTTGFWMHAPPALTTGHREILTKRILSGGSEVRFLLTPAVEGDITETEAKCESASRALFLDVLLPQAPVADTDVEPSRKGKEGKKNRASPTPTVPSDFYANPDKPFTFSAPAFPVDAVTAAASLLDAFTALTDTGAVPVRMLATLPTNADVAAVPSTSAWLLSRYAFEQPLARAVATLATLGEWDSTLNVYQMVEEGNFAAAVTPHSPEELRDLLYALGNDYRGSYALMKARREQHEAQLCNYGEPLRVTADGTLIVRAPPAPQSDAVTQSGAVTARDVVLVSVPHQRAPAIVPQDTSVATNGASVHVRAASSDSYDPYCLYDNTEHFRVRPKQSCSLCNCWGCEILTPLPTRSLLRFIFRELPNVRDVPDHVTLLRSYCGEQASLYFIFVTFVIYYMLPLVISAVVFSVFHILEGVDSSYVTWNSVVLLFWVTWFNEYLARKQSELAMHWDRRRYQNVERISNKFRPLRDAQNRPRTKVNKVTLVKEGYYPTSRRRMKMLVSALVTLLMMGVVCTINVTVLRLSPNGNDTNAQYTQLALSISSALLIQVCKLLFAWLAQWLSTWENHKLDSETQLSQNLKTFAFSFFNEFFAFFWIMLGFDGASDRANRLFIQAMSSVLTAIGTNIALQQFLPWLRFQWDTRRSTCCLCCRCDRASVLAALPLLITGQHAPLPPPRNSRARRSARVQAEFELDVMPAPAASMSAVSVSAGVDTLPSESAATAGSFGASVEKFCSGRANGSTHLRTHPPIMPSLNPDRHLSLVSAALVELSRPIATEIQSDYQTIVVLLGYVVSCAAVFPTGALFVIVAVWFERQGDLWRYLTVTRRAPLVSAENIGAWSLALSFLSYMAIVSNGVIFFYATNQAKDMFDDRDFAFVCYLLIVGSLKSLISRAVDDSASWVRWKEQRLNLEQQEREKRFSHRGHRQHVTYAEQLQNKVDMLQKQVDLLSAGR